MRMKTLLARAAAALTLFAAQAAVAQPPSVALNNFRQSETPTDDFAISRPTDSGDFQVGAHLHIDYANDPLTIEQTMGDAGSELTPVVANQVTGQFGLSLGLFNRLVLYVGLPVHFMMDGTDEAEALNFGADGGGLGDIYFGGRFRIIGESDDAFALALQVSGTGNSARSQAFGTRSQAMRYSGDDWLTVHPELLAEVRVSKLRVTLNVGYRIRRQVRLGASDPSAMCTASTEFNPACPRIASDSQTVVNDELTLGLGLGYTFFETENHNTLDVIAQAILRTTTDNFFETASTPMETIIGLKYRNVSGLNAGLAGGIGLIRGYGAPDFRVIGMLGYQMPPQAAGDEDEDGEGEGEGEGESDVDPATLDSDGDGIPDASDAAPNDAEDMDGFEDEDGAPDPDNDNDGVLDVDDGAPMDAEDRDEFQDEDGVPDPDNDNDGVLDADDRCATEAEDRDGIQDDDGCPETDADSDTIVDENDHCPLTPGVLNEENPECGGCPALACVGADGSIRIMERVEFATNDDVILDRSAPVLRDVRAILNSNSQIRGIRIEGHTDNRGNAERNLDLSKRRAASVRTWLTENGIAAERLHGWGCGDQMPLAPNNTRRNRQNNRRVSFHITDPAPQTAREVSPGCVQVDEAPATPEQAPTE